MELQSILENAHTDDAMFRKLYDLTVNKVFHYLLIRTGDRDVAKDVTQDVYAALWRALAGFKYSSDEEFYGFLFTIVRRTLARSRRLRVGETHALRLEDGFDIAAPVEEHEDYRRLLAHLATLSHNQQLVIKLRYFSDFSFKEIASALGMSENNAKVLHHRALERLHTLANDYV